MEVEANGKTFTFPDGTTNAQIGEAVDDYFTSSQQTPAPQKASPTETYNKIKGEMSGYPGASFIEPAVTMATGMIAEPMAGLAGIGQTLNPFADAGAGSRAVKGVKDLLTIQPWTDEGKAGLKAVGDAMQESLPIVDISIADMAKSTGEAFGQSGAQTLEALGQDPALGYAMGRAMPAALGMSAGPSVAGAISRPIGGALKSTGRGAKNLLTSEPARMLAAPAVTAAKNTAEVVSNIPAVKRLTDQSAKNQEIARFIEAKSTNNELAKFNLDSKGRVVDDKLAKDAMNQGWRDGDIQALKMASPEDRAKAAKMTRIRKQGSDNTSYQNRNRPSDVAGQTFMDRYNYVKRVNKKAGKNLDNVANSLRGEKVDFSNVISSFQDDLSRLDVKLSPEGKLDFKDSVVDGLPAQKAIEKMVESLKSSGGGGKIDAYNGHQMKRRIDEIVNYDKMGEGLSGQVEGVFKGLRAGIDDVLDSNFDRYNKVNTDYSETIRAINSFRDVAGKKMNMSGKDANKAVGTLLRRLTGNAVSRVPLGDAVDMVTATANKYGGNFTDDIRLQASYANQLDEMFGPVADTSLLGDVTKAAKSGAVDMVAGGTPTRTTGNVLGSIMNRSKKSDSEKAYKSIMKMLNYSNY